MICYPQHYLTIRFNTMLTITILLLLAARVRGHELRFDDDKTVTIFSEGYAVELHQP